MANTAADAPPAPEERRTGGIEPPAVVRAPMDGGTHTHIPPSQPPARWHPAPFAPYAPPAAVTPARPQAQAPKSPCTPKGLKPRTPYTAAPAPSIGAPRTPPSRGGMPTRCASRVVVPTTARPAVAPHDYHSYRAARVALSTGHLPYRGTSFLLCRGMVGFLVFKGVIPLQSAKIYPAALLRIV